ncbi:unnamed protein product [Lathyrus oleraceus]
MIEMERSINERERFNSEKELTYAAVLHLLELGSLQLVVGSAVCVLMLFAGLNCGSLRLECCFAAVGVCVRLIAAWLFL